MTKPTPDIVLISDRIGSSQLAELVGRFFTDMVKFVVDVERGTAAVGGELRAGRLMAPDKAASRRLAYERVLRLVDLTIAVADRRAVRRELLRWRDLVAVLFLDETAQPVAHRKALRALLQQTPDSAAQIKFLAC